MTERLVGHPVADELTEEYFLFETQSSWVTLTSPLRAVIQDARSARVRPVLLTRAEAMISSFVAEALRDAGGFWACHTPHGVYDALSGYRISSFRELWTEHSTERERLPGFSEPEMGVQGGLLFEAHVRLRADERTRVGQVAERMIAGLGAPFGAGGLERWDWQEPLVSQWSLQRVTLAMQGQMPRSDRLLAAGPGGVTASIAAARANRGLLEHTRGIIPLGPASDITGASPYEQLLTHPAISETLSDLSERPVPAIIMVSRGQFEQAGPAGAPGMRARRRALDEPLAVLIGAAGVHALGLDFARLAERHDITRLGPGRVPSALIRFRGHDPLWHQFMAFAFDLDRERLAAVLDVNAQR